MGVPANELHRIVPTAIIYRDDEEVRKYLILKRSPDKKVYPGRWTVLGGGVETGDYVDSPKDSEDGWYYTVEKTLQREIAEEAGVEVAGLRYLLDMTFVRPDNVPVLVLSYYGRYVSGEVKLDEDSIEFAWVTQAEARDYDLLPGIAEEIDMVEQLVDGADPAEVRFVPAAKSSV